MLNYCKLILIIFLSFSNWANAKETKNTKEVMGLVYSSFSSLLPYLSSELKFSDPKSYNHIKKNISILKSSFSQAKHIERLKSPGFSVTRDLVIENIEEASSNFTHKNYFFARKRLVGMTSLCINCHSQLNMRKGKLSNSQMGLTAKSFDSIYSYAEFLFLTRNFKKSISFYEKSINQRLHKNEELKKMGANMKLPEKDVREALLRIISINTKIDLNPKEALSNLEKFKDEKRFSKFLREDISNWIVELKEWSHKEKSLKKIGVSDFVEKHLAPLKNITSFEDGKHDILLLLSSGMLLRSLTYLKEANEQAQALYWLAVVEGNLSHNLFYSLADSYLLKCIYEFPKSSFAKKCYSLYDENIKIGYSGSAGLNIPQDIQERLKKLKSLIK